MFQVGGRVKAYTTGFRFLIHCFSVVFCFVRIGNQGSLTDAFSIAQPKTLHLKQQLSGSTTKFHIHTVQVQAHQTYLVANIFDFDGIAELRVENRCRFSTVRVRQAHSTESWIRVESGQALPYIRFDPTVGG